MSENNENNAPHAPTPQAMKCAMEIGAYLCRYMHINDVEHCAQLIDALAAQQPVPDAAERDEEYRALQSYRPAPFPWGTIRHAVLLSLAAAGVE
jgi:hypothetical protein